MGYGHVAERAGMAINAAGLAPARVPSPVLDAYVGAFAARAVMGATSLGVFDVLASAPRTAADVARCCDIDPDGADVLLTALHSLGYVRARGGGYQLTAMSRRWLVPESPD